MIIAVIDIGKTTLKVALAEAASGRVVAQASRPNEVDPSPPFSHFDTAAMLDWCLAAIAELSGGRPVQMIVPVAHGASVALADSDGLVFPPMDYEASEPDETRADYARLRPPFSETFSPHLPKGMNFGSQIHWLMRRFPDRFGRVRHILAYPQMWSFLLSGAPSAEVTSFACHSDLWAPAAGRWSSLVETLGLGPLMPALQPAWRILGPLLPELKLRSGLCGECLVLCGIHDSNASLLPHLERVDGPFTLVSSGTWAICMAVGGKLDGLAPDRDRLANVDVYGRPVPTARFMGGREFAMLTEDTESRHSDPELVDEVLAGPALIAPGLIPGVGPFPEGAGGWLVDPADLDQRVRRTAAACYIAQMIVICRELAGGSGPLIIEGPFARNRSLARALKRLGIADVRMEENAGGTLAGALKLAQMAAESGEEPGK